MIFFTSVLTAVVLISFSVNTFSISYSNIVETIYGPVSGYQYQSTSTSSLSVSCTINAWKGIPFAAPPIGNLRWRSPQKHNNWTHALPTTSSKSYCIQASSSWLPGAGSEDCLYLNVYTKADSSENNNELYPVLFYIYGGGLMSGAADLDFGPFLCSSGKGLVIVEVAYRVNIFGFLATEELLQEQQQDTKNGEFVGNYGIQDQVFALQWVRNNIKNFNGDPNRVTIAGQSSGGTSVFSLLSSPHTVGLFHGAISLSGSPNMSMPIETVINQNAPIVTSSGCRPSSNANKANGNISANISYQNVLSCMRKLSSQQIASLIPQSWDTFDGLPSDPTGLHWPALVTIDGRFITRSFEQAFASSTSLHNVPVLLGWMGQEPDPWPEIVVYGQSSKQWKHTLKEQYADLAVWGDLADILFETYLNESSVDPQKAYDSIITDYAVACGNKVLASAAYPNELYLYANEWPPEHPVLVDEGTKYSAHFAYHMLDLLFLVESWPNALPTKNDRRAARLLQRMWHNFIASGKPLDTAFDGHESWKPASNSPAGPLNVYVMQPSGSVNIKGYRDSVCSTLLDRGIATPEFWWSN